MTTLKEKHRVDSIESFLRKHEKLLEFLLDSAIVYRIAKKCGLFSPLIFFLLVDFIDVIEYYNQERFAWVKAVIYANSLKVLTGVYNYFYINEVY